MYSSVPSVVLQSVYSGGRTSSVPFWVLLQHMGTYECPGAITHGKSTLGQGVVGHHALFQI